MRQPSTVTVHSPAGVFRGVPSFIRASIREAGHGGAIGYEQVGFQLGEHVYNLEPDGIERKDWFALLETHVEAAVQAGDEPAVLAFVSERFPRVFQMIPPRRVGAFLRGFIRSFSRDD